MDAWWEILSVFLFSTIKFFFGGVPLALGYNFSHLESIIVTSAGGCTGVFIFVFASDKLIAFFQKRAALKKLNNPNLPQKKKFTRTNRIIIGVKRKFGLWGFAFIVPFLIPVPIGCFLTVRYFNDKKKIIFTLCVSIVFWAVTGAFLYKPLFDAIRYYIL